MNKEQKLLIWFENHLQDEWFAKHYGGYYFPIFVQGYYALVNSHNQLEFSMPHGVLFQNYDKPKSLLWNWNVLEMRATRKKVFENFEIDTKFADNFYNTFLNGFEKFKKAEMQEKKIDIKKLPVEQIIKRLINLINIGNEQGIAYTVDCLMSIGEDNWYAEYANKYAGKNLSDKDLDILRQPTIRTFINQFELDILQAGVYLSQNKTKYNDKLKSIKEKFYWIKSNYLQAESLSIEEIEQKIRKIKNPNNLYKKEYNRIKNNIENKKKIYEKINASPLFIKFIKSTDVFVHMQDTRKQFALRLNYFIFKYLKEIADKLNIDLELILQLNHFELSKILKERDKYLEIAQKRLSGFLTLYDKNGYYIYYKDQLKDLNLEVFFPNYKNLSEVKGVCASPGTVRGRVRIVFSSDDFVDFKKGEILVTNQTTPEFVPIMKKAKAIIAEQGGITSHAAVISRELKIPCIVGVKHAMQVFKNGNLVELNNNGKIKIINNK